jgi:hypothetical protein
MTQWEHNRSLLVCIPTAYPERLVTIAFYTELQSVDALLAYDNVTANNHDMRNTTLKQTNRYGYIWRHYSPLYDLSREVRYLAAPSLWIPHGEVESKVLKKHLYPIEPSVEKLMPHIAWPVRNGINLKSDNPRSI